VSFPKLCIVIKTMFAFKISVGWCNRSSLKLKLKYIFNILEMCGLNGGNFSEILYCHYNYLRLHQSFKSICVVEAG